MRQGTPSALDQAILMLTMRSGELQSQRQRCHQGMELVGVENCVVVETNTVELEAIGLGEAAQLLETGRTWLP